MYAEDPGRGFLPAAGTVLAPGGAVGPAPHPGGLRRCRRAPSIGTSYDPMLAKVMAWGPDRAEALARLRGRPGGHRRCSGVTTNVGFLRRLVAHPDVIAGRLDTELVERIGPDSRRPGGARPRWWLRPPSCPVCWPRRRDRSSTRGTGPTAGGSPARPSTPAGGGWRARC